MIASGLLWSISVNKKLGGSTMLQQILIIGERVWFEAWTTTVRNLLVGAASEQDLPLKRALIVSTRQSEQQRIAGKIKCSSEHKSRDAGSMADLQRMAVSTTAKLLSRLARVAFSLTSFRRIIQDKGEHSQ